MISSQPALFLPSLIKAYSPTGVANDNLSSAAQIQNLDASNAMNSTLTYFTVPGGAPFASLTINVPAQTMNGVDQRFDPTVGSSFTGSGIFASDRSAAALVNLQSAGDVSTYGSHFRFASYSSTPGATDAGTNLSLPQVLKNIFDSGQNKTWTSLIVLQNTTATAATANITYSGIATPTSVNVPAWGAAYVWLGSVTEVGSSFFGSATVSASQPLVALVEQHSDGGLLAYKGFASGATKLYAPQILKGVYDSEQNYTWSTAIMAMALSGSPNVTITCLPAGGTTPIVETLPATPFASFDQRPDGNFPNGFFGSCEITSSTTDPIVAIVNMQTNADATRGARLMTYPGLRAADGSTNTFAPQLLKSIVDGSTGVTWSSAMTVQALNGSADITLTYQGLSAVGPFTCSPQCNIDQRFDPTLSGATYFGSAKITSTAPIAIKVNFTGSAAAAGDAADNYIAIKQ